MADRLAVEQIGLHDFFGDGHEFDVAYFRFAPPDAPGDLDSLAEGRKLVHIPFRYDFSVMKFHCSHSAL